MAPLGDIFASRIGKRDRMCDRISRGRAVTGDHVARSVSLRDASDCRRPLRDVRRESTRPASASSSRASGYRERRAGMLTLFQIFQHVASSADGKNALLTELGHQLEKAGSKLEQ